MIEIILSILETKMLRPSPFGWFHLLWLALTVLAILSLHRRDGLYDNRQLKKVVGTYSIIALVLEVVKQVIWSIDYNSATNIITWDYQWYAAPFQLCTTPLYACLISLFLDKNSKLRRSLLSYVAFVTILGSIATIFVPDSCFTETAIINIHTMWLHYGSFVVSVYLVMSGEIEPTLENLKNALKVFLIFTGIALLLNIGVYHSGVLNGETFNMFYISPYFISELPVFNIIQEKVPYMVFLLVYIFALSIGSLIVLESAKLLKAHSKRIGGIPIYDFG